MKKTVRTPDPCPVQINCARCRTTEGKLAKAVYLRAYEVYCKKYGPQDAMIDENRWCRGGFTVGEIVGFLYARSFPEEEWSDRVDEAFRGIKLQ